MIQCIVNVISLLYHLGRIRVCFRLFGYHLGGFHDHVPQFLRSYLSNNFVGNVCLLEAHVWSGNDKEVGDLFVSFQKSDDIIQNFTL